jgi:uncharacterized membrane protein YphA (DoxX/SURF4 family)
LIDFHGLAVWAGVGAAGIILQRRPTGAGSQPHRAVARAGHAYPRDDWAILRCNSRAVLQLRPIHARQSRSRVPPEPLSPQWLYGHAIWTYLAAVVYAVAGTLLLVGKKTRAAATWLGLTVLFVVLFVYLPIGVVERASLGKGLNYLADTLMFCGTILLLAGAMPQDRCLGGQWLG